MWKKFRITVDGKPYTVTVEEIVEGSAASALSSAGTVTAAAAMNPPSVQEKAPTSQPVTAGAGDVTSPVGGVVKEVKVSIGQQVQEGDLLVVLEAMKMKTNIFSNLTGKVDVVYVKPGDAVDTGQALVSIS